MTVEMTEAQIRNLSQLSNFILLDLTTKFFIVFKYSLGFGKIADCPYCYGLVRWTGV